MYEFWFDYLRPKYQHKANLCYMNIDSFIVNKKRKIFMKSLQIMLNKYLAH